MLAVDEDVVDAEVVAAEVVAVAVVAVGDAADVDEIVEGRGSGRCRR